MAGVTTYWVNMLNPLLAWLNPEEVVAGATKESHDALIGLVRADDQPRSGSEGKMERRCEKEEGEEG